MADFRIKLKYIYEIEEMLSNTKYKIDGDWDDFRRTIKYLSQPQKYGCDIPAELYLSRHLKIAYARNCETGEIIQPSGEIMGVRLRDWVSLAGFKKYSVDELRYVYDEGFGQTIIVSFDGKNPTIGSLRNACQRESGRDCNKCKYSDCRYGNENTPAYYSNCICSRIVPLNPERDICISKDCRHLYPQSSEVNSLGVTQKLRDFFVQPDLVEIQVTKNNGVLSMKVYSPALRER